MKDYLKMAEVLTYDFLTALYEANHFSFDQLLPWLRNHVIQGSPDK